MNFDKPNELEIIPRMKATIGRTSAASDMLRVSALPNPFWGSVPSVSIAMEYMIWTFKKKYKTANKRYLE